MNEIKLEELQREHSLSRELMEEIRGIVGERDKLGDILEEHSTVRYKDLGQLGVGAMGEVRRVLDLQLGRTIAMKIAHPELMARPSALARFIDEAQCQAQLQHHGLVSVHELGKTLDGLPYFTMTEVRGRDLKKVLMEVHRASDTAWCAASSGWGFHKLIDAFHQVCEAVAFAHNRGVIHRDLKPNNIMLGDHGEVLVVDWGLAKVLGQPDRPGDDGDILYNYVSTARSEHDSYATQMGVVTGTRAYMPPEQARGDNDQVDARSDVYALGATLFEVLCGRPPSGVNDNGIGPAYVGTVGTVVDQETDYEAPGRNFISSIRPLPDPLVEACMKAMSVDKEQRQADAGVLAREIGAWLDGSKRREQALAVVEEAEAKAPERENLLRKAAALRVEAALFLQEIEPWRPEADKFEGWAKEDEALLLDERCELLVHEQEQLLQASLTHLPDLPEAHIALAKMYRGQHVALERDHLDTLRVEGLLRYHTEALPVDHPERLEYERYLSGDGSLTLITEPSGAEVALFRYELRHRRLVPTFVRSLGVTPLEGVELKRGSYMCVVTHPERREVRYPVCINRGEQWEGVRPSGDGDGAVAETVNLPYSDDLGENDIFIAPGWFLAGGDHNTTESLSRRHVWVDAFVMRRFSLTNGEYIEFLNDMVANGKEEEALSRAPRDRAGKLMYGFESGYFELVTDEDGDKWEADWPVCMINWFDAVKYTEWLSERTGEAWRLPHEIEWEKAARGVDGRFRPWGDGFDSSWAITFNSHEHRPLPAVVDSYPVDCSVYGVRGLAGNMVDWCCHLYDIEQPEDGQALVFDSEQMPSAIVDDSAYRAARGGSCYYSEAFIRVCLREHHYPGVTFSNVGFRLVRSI